MLQTKTNWQKAVFIMDVVFLLANTISAFPISGYVVWSNRDSGFSSTYTFFWGIMIVVYFFHLIFFVQDYDYFSKKLLNKSKLDVWLFITILLRNILFLLNFIPFIQLMGLAGDVFVGWLILILYVVFLSKRLAKG